MLHSSLFHRLSFDGFSLPRHVRVVDVIEMVRGIAVVLHDEPVLAFGEQEFDPFVLVGRVAEAAELEDPPGFVAVHTWISPAQIGWLAGLVDAGCGRRRVDVVRAVDRLQRNSGHGLMLLFAASRHRVLSVGISPGSALENHISLPMGNCPSAKTT